MRDEGLGFRGALKIRGHSRRKRGVLVVGIRLFGMYTW